MSWGGWLGAGWGGRRLCCCLVPGPGSRNLESSVAGVDAPVGRGAAWAPHSFCLSQLPQGGRTAAVRKQAVSLSGAFTVVLCSHSHFPAAPTLLSPGDRWSVLPNVVWGTSCKWGHSARNPRGPAFYVGEVPWTAPEAVTRVAVSLRHRVPLRGADGLQLTSSSVLACWKFEPFVQFKRKQVTPLPVLYPPSCTGHRGRPHAARPRRAPRARWRPRGVRARPAPARPRPPWLHAARGAPAAADAGGWFTCGRASAGSVVLHAENSGHFPSLPETPWITSLAAPRYV